MTEPKRYFFEARELIGNNETGFYGIREMPVRSIEHEEGHYVCYEDYARIKAEVDGLAEIVNSFKTLPIVEQQSFKGWKSDEEFRLMSLVKCLQEGSIEGAKQFTHKWYKDFTKCEDERG